MSTQKEIEKARLKIEHWCAYQERCIFESQQKLNGYGLNNEEIDQLLAHLIENRFLDEERFAESYAQGKFSLKKWGKQKIYMHLKAKRISKPLILQALKTLDAELYQQTIEQLMLKKISELKPHLTAYEKKGKVHQYLGGKGYEFELIENQLNKLQL